jgi:hypothetical protein
LDRFKVTFTDFSIEIYEAKRVVRSYGRVRLMDADHQEVASWDEEEVEAIQKFDDD